MIVNPSCKHQTTERKSVALVTHTTNGGVWSVVRFLKRVIELNPRYRAEIIVAASSSRDVDSIRIRAPLSWLSSAKIVRKSVDCQPYWHAGCRFAELETQRYQPRRELTGFLDSFDIVQVVAGAPAWALLAAKTRRPVVLQVATLVSKERSSLILHQSGIKKLYTKSVTHLVSRLEEIALSHVALAFVENAWMRDHVAKIIGTSRTVFAPPGIDDSFWQPARYQDNGFLLCVGRLSDPRKNLSLLLRAYVRAKAQVEDLPKLVLVSENGLTSEQRRQISLTPVAQSLEVFENIALSDLKLVFQNASMLLLSSDEEGLGMAILEAMATALPVIATDCGGPGTLIVDSETGLLVPVGDEVALASSICSLWSSLEKRQSYGTSAKR